MLPKWVALLMVVGFPALFVLVGIKSLLQPKEVNVRYGGPSAKKWEENPEEAKRIHKKHARVQGAIYLVGGLVMGAIFIPPVISSVF